MNPSNANRTDQIIRALIRLEAGQPLEQAARALTTQPRTRRLDHAPDARRPDRWERVREHRRTTARFRTPREWRSWIHRALND